MKGFISRNEWFTFFVDALLFLMHIFVNMHAIMCAESLYVHTRTTGRLRLVGSLKL